jgi:hypothetical protein
MIESSFLRRTYICRAAHSALLIEKFAIRETRALGIPHQYLTSRHGAVGNFFFRNGDENGRCFNADSGAEFGD